MALVTLLTLSCHSKSIVTCHFLVMSNPDQVKLVDELQTVIRLDENFDFYLSLNNIDARDEDSQRDTIDFEVVTKPKIGKILLNNRPAKLFTRADLSNGRIKYSHKGEIGPIPVTDGFSIIARDRQECV